MKLHVKSILKEIVLGVLFLFILSNVISYIRKPELNTTDLPKLEITLMDGREFQHRTGEPLVIHFWATWCPTCKLEASNIEAISQKYEVLTIAVNSGEDTDIKAYMKKRGLTFKVLNDPEGKWAEQFNVKAFPTTFIYSSQGKLIFTEVGYTTTAGLLARLKIVE